MIEKDVAVYIKSQSHKLRDKHILNCQIKNGCKAFYKMINASYVRDRNFTKTSST